MLNVDMWKGILAKYIGPLLELAQWQVSRDWYPSILPLKNSINLRVCISHDKWSSVSPAPFPTAVYTRISQTFNGMFIAWPNVHRPLQSSIGHLWLCLCCVWCSTWEPLHVLQHSEKSRNGRNFFRESTARFCADKRKTEFDSKVLCPESRAGNYLIVKLGALKRNNRLSLG